MPAPRPKTPPTRPASNPLTSREYSPGIVDSEQVVYSVLAKEAMILSKYTHKRNRDAAPNDAGIPSQITRGHAKIRYA